MTKVINLNRARKARDRKQRRDKAAENRTRHGRTRSEKVRDTFETKRLDRHLDQTRRPEAGSSDTAGDDGKDDGNGRDDGGWTRQ